MCRLGSALYPWQDVAPAVMGALAFGWDWQHMLPAGGGIPVKVPASEARQLQLDARKVSMSTVLSSVTAECSSAALCFVSLTLQFL